MRTSSQQRLIFMGVILLTVCGTAFYFMNLIFDLRIRELRSSLRSLNNNQVSFRTLALISRYQLIRDRMVKTEETKQFKNEGKTMLALSHSSRGDESENFSFADRIGVNLLNSLNWLTGAKPMRNYKTSVDQKTLELAYLYEIKRDYVKAVEVYDLAIKILPETNDHERQDAHLPRGSILYHREKKNENLTQH